MNDYIRLLPSVFPYACEPSDAQLGLAMSVLTTNRVRTSFAVTQNLGAPDEARTLWASAATRRVLLSYEWLTGELGFRLTAGMRAEQNPAEDKH